MSFIIFLYLSFIGLSNFPLSRGHPDTLGSSSSLPTSRFDHFQFRSDRVNGRKIAVVSLMLDPERDRRSILVPDAEGLLHPVSFGSLDRQHTAFSPSEYQEWYYSDTNSSNVIRSNISSIGEGVDLERNAAEKLNDIENSLIKLEEEMLAEMDKKRSGNKVSGDVSSVKKRREGKREGKRKRKRKRKKNKEKRKKRKRKAKQFINIIGPRLKLYGQDACQYRILRKCAKKMKILSRSFMKNVSDIQKCDSRKGFLDCVESRRNHRTCKRRSIARGNLPGLRSFIRKLFWTSSSCLVNESMKRR